MVTQDSSPTATQLPQAPHTLSSMSSVQNSNVASALWDAPCPRFASSSLWRQAIDIDVDDEEASGGARSPSYAYVPTSPHESDVLAPQVPLRASSRSAQTEIDACTAVWSSSFLKTVESHPTIKLRKNDIKLMLAMMGAPPQDVDCCKAFVILSGRAEANGNLLELGFDAIFDMLRSPSFAGHGITILNNLCKTTRDAEFICSVSTTSTLLNLIVGKRLSHSQGCVLLLHKLLTMTSDNLIPVLIPKCPVDDSFIHIVLSLMKWDPAYFPNAVDLNRAGLTILFALLQTPAVGNLLKYMTSIREVFRFLTPSTDNSSANIALDILQLLLHNSNFGVRVLKWMSNEIRFSTATLDHIVLLVQFFANTCDLLLSHLVCTLGEKSVLFAFQSNGVSFEAVPLLKAVLVKWVQEQLVGCVDLSLIHIAEAIGFPADALTVMKRKAELASLGLSNLTRPPQFICPITMEEFVDPVIASDGKTYEREALEMHFATSMQRGVPSLSPLTREVLMTCFMKPNRDLKQLMESFHETALFIAKQSRTALEGEAGPSSGTKRVANDADDAAVVPAKRVYKTKSSSRKQALFTLG